MKIVIISANCYPFLSPRSHRATQLAMELAKRGNDVTVYSLLGDFDYKNFSEETNVNFKNLGISKFGLQDNTHYRNNNLIYKVLGKLVGRFIVFPYIELIKLVKNTLPLEKDIDILITLAHPHTIHWAVSLLKRKNYKIWIADCGDPFMGDPINYYPFYFKYIEKRWCSMADYITIPIESARDAYYKEFHHKIKVIPQGFNFDDVKLAAYEQNNIPTFAYSGVIYEGNRDPRKFIEFLSTLDIDFKFIIYTKNKVYFEQFKSLLGGKMEIRDYIPRNKLLEELSKVDFLINMKNNSELQQPSKLIDYYLTNRPILEISTEFTEKDLFNSFINKNYENKLQLPDLQVYNIKNVVNKFLDLV